MNMVAHLDSPNELVRLRELMILLRQQMNRT